jgi:HAD superfamily hydrolase (TIGR01549 family)
MITYIETMIERLKIKCVIFDLDGTLVDTLELHVEAFLRVVRGMGIEVPRDRIEQNMGRTAKDVLRTIVPGIDDAGLAYYAEMKEDILTELLGEIHPLPGSVELLMRLKNLGVPLVLASSTTSVNVIKILQVTGLIDYFDRMVTAENIATGKPDPDVFIKAAAKGGAQPNYCLVIGDSIHDIAAALGAGCIAVAVASGKHTREQLSALGPKLTVSDLTELL